MPFSERKILSKAKGVHEMNKLLHAGIHRYLKSLVFWFAMAATTAVAIYCSYRSSVQNLDDIAFVLELIIISIMITLIVGREFDEGVIRNKIVSGHTKGSVFVAELILAIGACTVLFMIFTLITAVFNAYIFSIVPSSIIVRIFFDCLFANIVFVTICVTVSSLIPHRAVVSIVCLLLVFGLYNPGQLLSERLSYPEYDVTYDDYDAYGNPLTEDSLIEGTDGLHLVKDECYISGSKRIAYYIGTTINPWGHLFADQQLLNMGFKYELIRDYHLENISYAYSEYPEYPDYLLTEEDESLLNIRLASVPFAILFVAFFGYILFRRRDFK